MNKNTGHFGYTNWWKNKRAAQNRAMDNCRKFSKGVAGCEVRLTTQKCFAVSYVGRNVYFSEATSKSKAASTAAALCESKHGAACISMDKHRHCAKK